jgi:tetratricopeptide (TPR) repeat protein
MNGNSAKNCRIIPLSLLAFASPLFRGMMACCLTLALFCGSAIANEFPVNSSPAPLSNQLNTLHHRISTKSRLAQRYFDQGLLLTYGFNHAEALRSFQTATALDPNCAMCYWGIAYVWGPNINAGMETEGVPSAWAAVQTANTLSSRATAPERAYIQALAQRYTAAPTADRMALNRAYANAMREVAHQYPDDLDAATLFAEALMDTTPWDYWQDNGEPKPEGQEIITTLEGVLKRDRNHPGALHYYIHAVEKKRPDLAIEVADRLRDLAIPIGHLLHMPSHIYLRVGRYEDAIASNQAAIATDQQYAQSHPNEEGIYTYAYMPHNHHFLWYAATLAGQKQLALEAAQSTAARVDEQLLREPGYGTLQHYRSIPLYTFVKFGMWDDILATPAPDADLVYPTGVWRYARGMALAAKRQVSEAARELRELRAIATSAALDGVTIWYTNTTADLLKIAVDVLAGEIATQQGNTTSAIRLLESAVQREDSLSYDEPAPWHSPVRQSLAAVLLQAGRAKEAEQVYREDLAMYPNNEWSRQGLKRSLAVQ